MLRRGLNTVSYWISPGISAHFSEGARSCFPYPATAFASHATGHEQRAGRPVWLDLSRSQASVKASLMQNSPCFFSTVPYSSSGTSGAQSLKVPRWSCNSRATSADIQRMDDGSQAPWTPTSQLGKRKIYSKRMKHMLQCLGKEYKEAVGEKAKQYPSFRAGDVLQVDMVVPENDMRPSYFRGMCISVCNNGPMTRFTLRNVVKGTGPVERSFLLYSPFITGIERLKRTRVRRAKLTYLRHKRIADSTF